MEVQFEIAFIEFYFAAVGAVVGDCVVQSLMEVELADGVAVLIGLGSFDAFAALAGGAAASRGGTQYGLPWLNEGGPFVVNALALACLSWLLRSRALAAGTAVMAAISLAVAATMSGDPAVAAQLAAYAAVLLAVSAVMGR